jgi:hypothetical protein
MSDVIHRTTLQFLPSVNEPDYPEPTWKWNPNMSGVVGVPSHYWKAPPSWEGDVGPVEMTAPEKAAVDQLQAIASQPTLTFARVQKLAPTTRTGTTTLADDPDLLFPVHPGVAYLFRGLVWYDTTAAADFKFTLAGPASPVAVRCARRVIVPGATAYSSVGVATAFGGAGIAATGTGTAGGVIEFQGGVVLNSNGGNVSFQWAQNTSDAGNTVVLRSSYLEWSRMP